MCFIELSNFQMEQFNNEERMQDKMDKTIIKVKSVEIGTGIPKICVSITGKNESEILRQAWQMKKNSVDIAEWRVDFFKDVLEIEKVIVVLEKLEKVLEDCPVLFTFRRKEEGGEKTISMENYRRLNLEVIESRLVSLVDVELFAGDELVTEIVDVAHKNGVKVVISNHDFTKTPEKEQLINRLQKMQTLGGDLPKIAVMPQKEKDVLTLLTATEEFNSKYANRPFITISMSKKGLISRLAGSLFGCAMTFGAVGDVSAPGQIEAGKLKEILELMR